MKEMKIKTSSSERQFAARAWLPLSAEARSRLFLTLLLSCLLALGSVPAHFASANPPSPAVGPSSVADGSAEDVLGHTLNANFSQPDFDHGAPNDAVNAYDLNNPGAVAVDAQNQRLFVADSRNGRILVHEIPSEDLGDVREAQAVLGQSEFKANATNRGGSTAANSLSMPQGLAYDATSKRLFAADSGNNRVLVYDIASIANGEDAVGVLGQADFTSGNANRGGNATANTLNGPYAVEYDAANNRLFVADGDNSRVLVYDVASIVNGEDAINVLGQADFTSGSGNRGGSVAANTLYHPWGLTYDAARNRLFVADNANSRVLAYDVASIVNGEDAINVLGQVDFTSSSGATTQSGLAYPAGLALDAVDNWLCVADGGNNRVLVYDVSVLAPGENDGQNAMNVLGQPDFTSAAASTYQRGLAHPTGMAYEAIDGHLWVADNSNNRVMAFDVNEELEDGEASENMIGLIDAAGQPVYTSASPVNRLGLAAPDGNAMDSLHHKLFVSDSSNNRVLGYNLNAVSNRLEDRQPDSVIGQADFTSSTAATDAGGLNWPSGLAYDVAKNRLFVADNGNSRVLVYDLSRIQNGQLAVNVLGQANLTSGGTATTQSGLAYPVGLALDATNNRLFVADRGNNRVVVYDVTKITDGEEAVAVLGQANFTASTASTTRSGLASPAGLAYDASNKRLFVGDNGNNRVLVYEAATITNGEDAGAVLGQADFTSGNASRGGSASANNLSGPYGLSYDAGNKRLFVADSGDNRVLVYDVTSITNGQYAVAVLGQSDFTSVSANRGGTVAANTLSGPGGVTYDATSKVLYVNDSGNNRTLVFNASLTALPSPGGVTQIVRSYLPMVTIRNSTGW